MARDTRGFTLIELLFTLVLISIMLVIAVPSFVSFISGNRVTTTVNDFLQGVTLTRAEALRRGRRVTLMPLTAPPPTGIPQLNGEWRHGWAVCDQVNVGTGTCSGSILFQRQPVETSTALSDPGGAAGQPFTDAASKTYVSFDGQGYPRHLPPDTSSLSGGILFIDKMGPAKSNVRKLCLAALGPARIAKDDTTPCTAN